MQTEDDRPARKITHDIGQDLSALSVGELVERIELLQAEIRRIEQEMGAKTDTKAAAESLFKL